MHALTSYILSINMLTPLHVLNYCNAGGSWWGTDASQCRYLTSERVGSKYVSLCMKKAPAIYAKRRPAVPAIAGDNCPGYTYLKHKAQGYDV